jgi:hypothetical protein
MIEKVICRREGKEGKGREGKRSTRQDSEDLRSQIRGWHWFFLFVVLLVSLEIIGFLLERFGDVFFVIIVSVL